METSQLVTIITTVAVTLVLGIILMLSGKKFDVKMLSFCAVSLGLSFGLSFIKFEMAYGGSITAGSMVPIILFAYMYGPTAGLFAGTIYGLLQFIQSPWFLTPVQFLLDYILGFAAIVCAGVIGLIASKKMRKGLIISVPIVYIVRYIMHILAGIIFYSTPDMMVADLPMFGDTAGMSAFIYSSLYNGIYIIPDMIIALVVTILITANKSFLGLVGKISLDNKDRMLFMKGKNK